MNGALELMFDLHLKLSFSLLSLIIIILKHSFARLSATSFLDLSANENFLFPHLTHLATQWRNLRIISSLMFDNKTFFGLIMQFYETFELVIWAKWMWDEYFDLRFCDSILGFNKHWRVKKRGWKWRTLNKGKMT